MSAVVTLGMSDSAQDREGDPRHFVRERDGDKLERLGLDELLRPGSQCVFVRLLMIEDLCVPENLIRVDELTDPDTLAQ